jgi:diguanylate cyclase (GGDEF)-like protein
VGVSEVSTQVATTTAPTLKVRKPREIGVSAFTALCMLVGGFVLFVCVRGFGLDVEDKWHHLLLFAVLVCLCEIKPINVARSTGVDSIVASTTFAFAILLEFGPVPAMVAQAVASLFGDLLLKKPIHKIGFNISQYWISLGAASIVLHTIADFTGYSDPKLLSWQWTVSVLAAGTTYFVVTNALVGTVVAIRNGGGVLREPAQTMAHEGSADLVLLALAPIVLVVADRSLTLLPLLLLPVFAVYRSAAVSAEKEHQALHDSLTDLPNRLNFSDALERRLAQKQGPRSGRAAVLLIDLDRFKEVNDTLGHQAGDSLLCMVGPRIQQVLPQGGVVARLGGDEFAVLLPDVSGEGQALAIASRISIALEDPFRIDDFNLEVEASTGVAMYPDHGTTSELLMKRADVAMYRAKGRHGHVQLSDPEQDKHSTRRLGLISELRSALSEGEILVYYQPKLDLQTGEVNSVEALVRWLHPKFGLLPPSEFVPIAEHTGLIRPLTSYVVSSAVQQAAAWHSMGLDVAVAVNLSARSLHDGGVMHDVSTLLAENQVPARLLNFEITESSIMADPARAKRILEQLKDMGLMLSIDDFGTGYSSLAYLQELPVSEIKIDRSFVVNLLENEADQVIVRSTIDLARNLGLKSTAEGVETPQVLRWLSEQQCEAAQGYHIARPMSANAVTAWLCDRLNQTAPAADEQLADVVPMFALSEGFA